VNVRMGQPWLIPRHGRERAIGAGPNEIQTNPESLDPQLDPALRQKKQHRLNLCPSNGDLRRTRTVSPDRHRPIHGPVMVPFMVPFIVRQLFHVQAALPSQTLIPDPGAAISYGEI